MSATVAPSSSSSSAATNLGSFSSLGGAGGDDNDPSRRRKLLLISTTHSIDGDPILSPVEENTNEDDEKVNTAGLSSTVNVEVPSWTQQRPRLLQSVNDLPYKCEVCIKRFKSTKALHGHMRSHPERKWRGVLPPALCPRAEQEMADFLVEFSGRGEAPPKFKYQCTSCLKEFATKQALGGHRASHKNRLGCYAKAKTGLIPIADVRVQPQRVVSKKWLKASKPAEQERL